MALALPYEFDAGDVMKIAATLLMSCLVAFAGVAAAEEATKPAPPDPE